MASDFAPAAQNTSAPPHTNNFDVLRFLLAVLVIAAHSYPLTGNNRADPLYRLTSELTLGFEAVAGFFFLSGFLVTQSWLRSRSIADYLKRRVLRIYPGFIAASLFTGWLIGPLGVPSRTVYWQQFPWRRFFAHTLTLRLVAIPPSFPGIFGANLNGSLWTIHIEFLCYLFVIVLGLLGCYRKYIMPLIACLAGVGLCIAQVTLAAWVPPHLASHTDYIKDPLLFTCFLIGACFFHYQDRIRYTGRGVVLSAILLALTICFEGGHTYLHLPFLAYLLFAFAFSPAIRLHRFARYGDFSYGMYLYAFPLQVLTAWYFGGGLTTASLFLLVLPLTLSCAIISWYGIEKPFLRWKQKKTPASKPKAAVGVEERTATESGS